MQPDSASVQWRSTIQVSRLQDSTPTVSPLVPSEAAVEGDACSVYHRCFVGTEVEDHSGDLFGGRLGAFRRRRSVLVRTDRADEDTVGGGSGPFELLSQRLCQNLLGGLGCGVRDVLPRGLRAYGFDTITALPCSLDSILGPNTWITLNVVQTC